MLMWQRLCARAVSILHSIKSATSRVRVAGPQWGMKGVVRTEEGEKSIAVSYIRRTLSLASIRAQSHSLLGRLEGLGRGVTAAMGRRREALELERVWLRERKAMALSLRNGFNILRRGFAKLFQAAKPHSSFPLPQSPPAPSPPTCPAMSVTAP